LSIGVTSGEMKTRIVKTKFQVISLIWLIESNIFFKNTLGKSEKKLKKSFLLSMQISFRAACILCQLVGKIAKLSTKIF